MADVTAPRPTAPDEPGPGAPAPAGPVAPAGPADPRAVRVRLAAASQLGDEPPMQVSPPAGPLRMTNPSIGTGPLGGIAGPEASEDDPGVLAQRRPVLVDGELLDAGVRPAGRGRYVLDEGGIRTPLVIEAPGAAAGAIVVREVLADGFRFEVAVEPERIASLRERATLGRAASAHGGPLEVKAIIPGRVVSVSVVPGDAVTAGQQLLVVEAMKMQNELRAPRDGTIERLGVAPGATIEVGDLLVVIS